MKKILLFFLSLLLGVAFISCESNILFQSPMPPNGKVLDAIPAEYMGTYLCESDSTYIIVKDDVVYRETKFEFKTSVKKVLSTKDCDIRDNMIYLPHRKECFPIDYISDDSISATLHEIDTLFNFNAKQVLKIYKGHLFLNSQLKDGNWITYMFTQLENRWLKWQVIQVPADIENLDDITTTYTKKTTKGKKTQFIVNPTQVEFEKILEKNYFAESDILIPQTPQLHF